MGETVQVTGNSGSAQGIQLQEVAQHGSIGDFLGSSLEGVDSGFIRCVYNAKNESGKMVTLLCEKLEGCCVTGCCPKDQFWMTGLIILLIFVLIFFCVGTICIIVCYQRTKSNQRKVEKEIYQSRMGSVATGHYTQPAGFPNNQYATGGGLPQATQMNQYDQNFTQSRRF